MSKVTLQDVRSAATTLAGQVVRTPCLRASYLSSLLDCELYLKLENLQHTGSFKDRGAFNRLRQLGAEEAARGVVAASAGNHAQGVAYHATRLGIPSVIVMPERTPFTKIARTEAFGGSVELFGDNLADSQTYANQLAEDRGLTIIHPYDDPHIIAGQGTIGLELLDDVPDLEDIIVPIGGGGLISGIATAARAVRPDIRVYGVESELFSSMSDVLKGVARTYKGTSLAEGIAVKQPGILTREIIAEQVEEIFVVGEAVLENAVQVLLTDQKVLGEGAGAAGLAALLEQRERFAGRKVATIICGGNIDQRLLAQVMMRGLVKDGRLVHFKIGIEDAPGMLGRIAAIIGQTGGNIVEVYHHRLLFNMPAKRAELEVIVETRDRSHAELIRDRLQNEDFTVAMS